MSSQSEIIELIPSESVAELRPFEIEIQNISKLYLQDMFSNIEAYLNIRYKKNEKKKKLWKEENLNCCLSRNICDNDDYEFMDFSSWLKENGYNPETLIGSIKNTLYLLEKIDKYQSEYGCNIELQYGYSIDNILDDYHKMFVSINDEIIIDELENQISLK